MTVDDVVTLAERAAIEGGQVAMDHFRTSRYTVRQKSGKMDPVTEIDLAVQERIVDVLRAEGIDDEIVGEEEGLESSVPASGRTWVIDPIDGTNNFVRGTRLWGVCIALVADGEPIGGVTHLPAMGDTYVAGDDATCNGEAISTSARSDPAELIVAPIFGLRAVNRPAYRRVTATILDTFGDVRQTGSGQATLAMIASGGLDAAVSTIHLAPWDTLVGVSLVRKAGGRVTDLDGNEWHHDSTSMVATDGAAHDHVLDAIRTTK